MAAHSPVRPVKSLASLSANIGKPRLEQQVPSVPMGFIRTTASAGLPAPSPSSDVVRDRTQFSLPTNPACIGCLGYTSVEAAPGDVFSNQGSDEGFRCVRDGDYRYFVMAMLSDCQSRSQLPRHLDPFLPNTHFSLDIAEANALLQASPNSGRGPQSSHNTFRTF